MSTRQASCSVKDCDRLVYVKKSGYCQTHYARVRRHGDTLFHRVKNLSPCLVENCNKVNKALGYCGAHYAKHLKYGNPLSTAKELKRADCKVSSCISKDTKMVMGFCRLHYQQRKREGLLKPSSVYVSRAKRKIKHGHAIYGIKSRTYVSWKKMRERCNSPKDIGYKSYGGRGIRVCEEWNNSFVAFLRDMGERPIGKTIDRLDSNGNYELKNCRWATNLQQARNKRNSKKA